MPPRPRRLSFVAALVRMISLSMLGVYLLVLSACAWFQKNEPYFPTPADVSCVYSAVESGVQDPAGIIAACPALAALAIEDLIKLISGIVLGKAHRIEMERAKAVHLEIVPADGGAR